MPNLLHLSTSQRVHSERWGGGGTPLWTNRRIGRRE
jgi:hypothetical protein